jgi:hypothetical protein
MATLSLCLIKHENVEASTSHNPKGLHGLLQGKFYFFYLKDLWEKGRIALAFLIWALVRGHWSALRHYHFTLRERAFNILWIRDLVHCKAGLEKVEKTKNSELRQ